jgi:hypothetical protein
MRRLAQILASFFVMCGTAMSLACSAYGEEGKKPLTREACRQFCAMGASKQKLGGTEKDSFNACADAKLCSDPNTHYYVKEYIPEDLLKYFNKRYDG